MKRINVFKDKKKINRVGVEAVLDARIYCKQI